MTARRARKLQIGLILMLFFLAGLGWFSHMAVGIASGGLVGLPGRERDLAQMQSQSQAALLMGGLFEGAGIIATVWLLSPVQSVWGRLSLGFVVALFVVALTFSVIHSV